VQNWTPPCPIGRAEKADARVDRRFVDYDVELLALS